MTTKKRDLELMWARHSADWRNGAQICSQWSEAASIDPRLLESRASGSWWETLHKLGATLLISREYEHLVIAASISGRHPRLSYFPVPHPSGLVVDRERDTVYLASTRNPNQIYSFKPVTASVERQDVRAPASVTRPLVPVSSTFYPGCMYLHDLARIGGSLHGNAVGHNAVVKLNSNATFDRVWWPKCIDQDDGGLFSKNYIQLNSIAAGPSLRDSYFSASSASVGRLRPGHLNYPVNGRGVIFSGRTREPVCTGLTRPHSARLSKNTVWVANSGYGELGFVNNGSLDVVVRLPGWTRGLCFIGDVAFVGTSQVIPRYARYAPGLDMLRSSCAVHAVSIKTGKVLGSLTWPYGNQIFAIDWIADRQSTGFFFESGSQKRSRETAFFYTYLTNSLGER